MKMKILSALGLLALTGCTAQSELREMMAWGSIAVTPAPGEHSVNYIVKVPASVQSLSGNFADPEVRTKVATTVVPSTCVNPTVTSETPSDTENMDSLYAYYYLQVRCDK